MRRILASAASLTLVSGILVGLTPSATAATSLGTVTVNYASFAWSITPSTLSGAVGDNFVLVNERNNDDDDPTTFVSLQNDSGSVSSGGNSCVGTGTCAVLDTFSTPRNSATFTIDSGGVIKVMRSLRGVITEIGTLTIISSESGSTPQVTMTFDGNGGNCSTNPIVITGAGGAAYQLPAEGSGAGQCRRDDYTLLGWSDVQDATSVDPNLGPGATVNFANAGGTMYAVWRPNGVEVVYDANVGAADQCIQGGSNVVGDARQSAPVVLQEGRDGGVAATQAPCTPVDAQLVGWALTGDGSSVVAPGAALPASFTRGSSYVLYAKWQVVYGLTFSAESLSIAPGELATVTITATLNGAPAANAVVRLAVAPTGQFELGSSSDVFTDATGQVAVTVIGSPNLTAASPPTTLTAAYGNTTASVSVAVERSIVIEGERGEVSGRSGIIITGEATGFAAGDRVVPYIGFPGQTGFTEAAARPVISGGSFTWQRKTGKRTLVYFTSEDGTVTSNTVIVPAK